jgi:hypothetical protein
VNASTIPAGQLACLLRDAADGICADAAAVELICRHGHFLHRPEDDRDTCETGHGLILAAA